jgi:hypothetical protein
LGEAAKWAIGEALSGALAYVYSGVGVAGNNPPANENDNGGTCYGISTYNTFGSLFGSNSFDTYDAYGTFSDASSGLGGGGGGGGGLTIYQVADF